MQALEASYCAKPRKQAEEGVRKMQMTHLMWRSVGVCYQWGWELEKEQAGLVVSMHYEWITTFV